MWEKETEKKQIKKEWMEKWNKSGPTPVADLF